MLALLLASAWRDGAVLQGAGWTKAAMLAVIASALCGLALAAWGGVRALQHEADNQRRAHAERARREASGLVAAYLQWHLERQLKSLPLVERT